MAYKRSKVFRMDFTPMGEKEKKTAVLSSGSLSSVSDALEGRNITIL